MSDTPTKPVGKGRTVTPKSPSASKAAAINDDVIPVLLAANPNLTLNYQMMTTLDPQHRTYFAWEHKCRKWRAKAKELVDAASANGESSKDAGDTAGMLTTKTMLETQGSDGEDKPIKKKRATKPKVTKARAKGESDILADTQDVPEEAHESDGNKEIHPL
ncbi:hypothetical protein MMC07_007916 [Pseudocyphellaria aurata]|nr:hypothetical protein [Pseudocyphellaria aurata]